MMDPDIRSALLEVFEEYIECIEEEYELPPDLEHVVCRWRVSDPNLEFSEENTSRRSSSSEDSVSWESDPFYDFVIHCKSLDLGSEISFPEDSDEREQ